MSKEKNKWKASELPRVEIDNHLEALAEMEAEMRKYLKLGTTPSTAAAIPELAEPAADESQK